MASDSQRKALLATLPFLLCVAQARAIGGALPRVETMQLTLEGALFQTPAPTGRDPELMLEVERVGGQWAAVTGVAREFNVGMHLGYVKQGAIGKDEVNLDVALLVTGDSWVPGGPAEYRLRLQRQPNGQLEGTYQGSFKGQTFQGRATGVLFTREYLMGEGFAPVQPGEHPRTVFRKAALPRLREKLKTPFGKAAFEKMSGPVGWGMQYQLTGDAKYAKLAQDEVAEIIYRNKGCSAAFAPARVLGLQVERVAVALDLCWDAWPADFKGHVVAWLRTIAERVFHDPQKISRSANWNVASNHVGSLYAGIAFAGLVLWGEKGPAPPKPTPPTTKLEIPPAADYKPGKDVPVAPFQPGAVPSKWLATERIPGAIPTDPFASVQGLDQVRPEAGTTVRLDGYELTFQRDDDVASTFENNIRIRTLQGKNDAVTFCLYTVLDVREGGLFKLRNPFSQLGRPMLVLNGHRLVDGQVVRLRKGLYPLLLLARILTRWSRFQPRFEKATEQEAEAMKDLWAREQADYKVRLAHWEAATAEWKRSGGLSVENTRLFYAGRRLMCLLYREAVGTGGFQAEVGHYNKDTTNGPDRYAAAYRHCFGYDVSPYPDITHYLPRHVFTYIFPEKGKPWAQDINGSVRIKGDYFAALFPIAPDRWKPAMLWAWNRITGATDEATRAVAVADDPAWGFVAYPLEMEPKPPAGIMPLVWEAPDFGFYAFRNGWRGGDDVVTQVFLKAHPVGGWSGRNAGTFRIAGLGKAWAVGTTDRERRRWNESVVWLPSDDLFEGALGRLAYLKTEKDGSGVVTVDLRDVYSRRKKGVRPYSIYGNIRREWAFEDTGITGIRSFGVDYSGRCGAPALFAVVDHIRGGHEKVWLWQVPGGDDRRNREGAAKVELHDDGFTIRQGDATLRATFLAPRPVKLEAGTRTMQIRKSAGHGAGKILKVKFAAVFATGGDDFFVVATLQRGEPPAVKVQGHGLEAAARIGGRTVAFDGKKVVFR